MGRGKMIKNLESTNIYRDEGKISLNIIQSLEKFYGIALPQFYVDFITQHNAARLDANVFDYDDPNRHNGRNADSIAFENVQNIRETIELIKSGEEPDWPIEYRFEDGLIPFGDNGGGDMICFDYRKDRETDNPPIVIWNHDMGLEHRVVFIAPNFEEFINMLHEPNDED